MKNLLLASTSTVFGGSYLDYLLPELNNHFKDAERLIFIPYARPGGITHDSYTDKAREAFDNLDIEVVGLHEFNDPKAALQNAEAVFTGGGNTFLLVDQLYKNDLMATLRERIFEGLPYLGTSAGTNIAGVSMQTTNDMPIIYPPSFKTIGAVPFNINPHYLDPIEGIEHMGETRETRIAEFHHFNTIPVVGLREGSWIAVNGKTNTLKGSLSARIFEAGKKPYELESGSVLNFD
ncbi:dipeptidase PepE [Leeuwenhoekiella sp. W20_SRS_FM14]|uniref:dipeptidase PepE n=1 Tax=Leeuwenhoekiella sp. W20_SRS_FM14 TaxID=3240270 RepID=UPI003F9C9A9B